MTNRTSPFRSLCDCRCPLHHGFERATYNDDGCGCAITCATQPLTLLARQWDCALFLARHGDLWQVDHMLGGQWDWNDARALNARSDNYQPGLVIERHLRVIYQAFIESIR